MIINQFIFIIIIISIFFQIIHYYDRYNYLKKRYLRKLNSKENIYIHCYKDTKTVKCGRIIDKYKQKKHNQCKNFFITIPEISKFTYFYNKVICNYFKYIIAIQTRPEEIEERLLFRKIYHHRNEKIKLLFFTTKSNSKIINQYNYDEMKYENDLVILNFIGSYCKGSLQVTLSFYWINKHCNNYIYVIHHQSDVYLNIYNCIEYLQLNKPELSGYISYKAPRKTNKKSLHYIPSNYYNKHILPVFPKGPLFTLKKNIIELISNDITNSSKIIWIDDVYIGFVIKNRNIYITDFNNMTVFYNPSKPFSFNCSFLNNKIYYHGLILGEISLLHKITKECKL